MNDKGSAMLLAASDTPVQMLMRAMAMARTGDRDSARRLLRKVVAAEPENEQGWAWLAFVAANDREKRAALRRLLALSPEQDKVREALQRLLTPQHVRQAGSAGIYVSYTRADELFTINLADDLRQAGIPVWLDISDIPDGDAWHEAVEVALKRCGLMLAILSPTALADPDLRAEARRFLDEGKIVVAVMHQSCDASALALWHPAVLCQPYQSGMRELLRLLTAAGQQAAARGS